MPFKLDFDSSLSIPSSEASLWSLALSSEKGSVMARYKGGVHDQQPAIISNEVGKGRVIVLGTDPGKPALKKVLLHCADKSGVKPLASGDENTVIVPRQGKERGWVIVNLAKVSKKVVLNSAARNFRNILTEEKSTSTTLELKPFEVRVLTEY